eukprot:4944194-Pleurochrysis_carterae.AAC.1
MPIAQAGATGDSTADDIAAVATTDVAAAASTSAATAATAATATPSATTSATTAAVTATTASATAAAVAIPHISNPVKHEKSEAAMLLDAGEGTLAAMYSRCAGRTSPARRTQR